MFLIQIVKKDLGPSCALVSKQSIEHRDHIGPARPRYSCRCAKLGTGVKDRDLRAYARDLLVRFRLRLFWFD